jgi:periplasmic protein TonB
VLWHENIIPGIHKDINDEISRIISLFHYEVTVKKTFEITIGFNYGLPIESEEDPAFVIVEEMPEFHYKNSKNGFSQYVKDNLNDTFSNCTGTIYVNFVVEKDGHIGDIKIIRGIESCIGYVEEIERIFKTCPAWIPGKQRGEPVRVRCNVPVLFGINN